MTHTNHELFTCTRLHAKISERQCKLNRNGYRSKGVDHMPHISCQGCVGLGESVRVSLPIQEEPVKKKKIECGRSGCGYGVKKEGDYCKKHQEPVIIPAEKQQRGLDDGPILPFCTVEPLHFCIAGMLDHACGAPAIMGTQSTSSWDDVTCENCLIWKPSTIKEAAHDDQQKGVQTEVGAGHEAHSAVAGIAASQPAVQSAVDHVDVSEPDPACLNCGGSVEGQDLFCGKCVLISAARENRTAKPDHIVGAGKLIEPDEKTGLPVGTLCDTCVHADVSCPIYPVTTQACNQYSEKLEIPPVAADPPQEQTEPFATLSPALAALVVAPEPIPETTVTLELEQDMFDELVAVGVGTDTIIELLHLLFISKEYKLARHAAG